jgi:hypothetical protein
MTDEKQFTDEEKFIELKEIILENKKEELYEYIYNEELIFYEIYNKFLRQKISIEVLREEFVMIMYSIQHEKEMLFRIQNTTNYYELISEIGNISSLMLEKEMKTYRNLNNREIYVDYEIFSSICTDETLLNKFDTENMEVAEKMINKLISELKGEYRIIATLLFKDKLPTYIIASEILNISKTKCNKIYFELIERLREQH